MLSAWNGACDLEAEAEEETVAVGDADEVTLLEAVAVIEAVAVDVTLEEAVEVMLMDDDADGVVEGVNESEGTFKY